MYIKVLVAVEALYNDSSNASILKAVIAHTKGGTWGILTDWDQWTTCKKVFLCSNVCLKQHNEFF